MGGIEGLVVWCCEALDVMGEGGCIGGERVDGYIRRWRFPAVRQQVDLERRAIFLILSAPFGDLSLVCRVVLIHVACGGFCGSHTRHVRLFLPQLGIFYRWRILRAISMQPALDIAIDPLSSALSLILPLSSALSLITSILLCGQAFVPSRHTPEDIFHGIFPPL